jgi:hypothetical protein
VNRNARMSIFFHMGSVTGCLRVPPSHTPQRKRETPKDTRAVRIRCSRTGAKAVCKRPSRRRLPGARGCRDDARCDTPSRRLRCCSGDQIRLRAHPAGDPRRSKIGEGSLRSPLSVLDWLAPWRCLNWTWRRSGVRQSWFLWTSHLPASCLSIWWSTSTVSLRRRRPMPCATVAPLTSISRSRFAPKGFCSLSRTTAAESEISVVNHGVSVLGLWPRGRSGSAANSAFCPAPCRVREYRSSWRWTADFRMK